MDGKPFADETLTPAPTLGALIDKAKADLAGSGSILFGVRCNGQDVPPQRLEEIMACNVTDFQQVELISGQPTVVVLDALNDTRRALAETFAKVQQSSVDLAKGNLAKGMGAFVQCVGIWRQVHEAILQSAQLLDIDIERLVLQGRRIVDWLDDLKAKLQQIKEAVEAGDQVLLGDILRYELDQTLQDWENMLNALVEHVQKLADAQ